MFKETLKLSEVSNMNAFIKKSNRDGNLISLQEFIDNHIDWDYKQIGFMEIIIRTHLKSDTYNIAKATITIDFLNKKVRNVEYNRGSYVAGKNYRNDLYITLISEAREY